MSNYTFDDLFEMDNEALKNIKESLQDTLYEIRKEKIIKIQNIISLQGMIEKEKE